MEWDGVSNEMTMTEVYNPDAQFEMNLQRRNLFDRSERLGPMNLVAEIPPEVYWALYREGRVEDRNDFRKWLDDSDNEKFRTNNLRLGKRGG